MEERDKSKANLWSLRKLLIPTIQSSKLIPILQVLHQSPKWLVTVQYYNFIVRLKNFLND